MIATPTPTETPLALESLADPLELESLDEPLELGSAGALESVGRTALPSASANASVSADVASVKRPVGAKMTTPVAIVAMDVVLARLIATAAATDTPPEEVSELGVCSASPAPVPPFDVEVWFPKERSCAIWSVTPLPAEPLLLGSAGAAAADSSCGAPAALALAVAELSDLPFAASVTAPPAARFRASVASLRWLAIVSASDTPIAAVLALASPSAVLFAEAV